MKVPAESSPAAAVRDKVVTAAEAVRLIRDGDSVVVEGFVGQCFAEELTLALEQRFLQTGTPQRPEPGVHRRPGRPAGPRAGPAVLTTACSSGRWAVTGACRRRWERWPWTTRSRRTTCRRGSSRSCSGTPPPASPAC